MKKKKVIAITSLSIVLLVLIALFWREAAKITDTQDRNKLSAESRMQAESQQANIVQTEGFVMPEIPAQGGNYRDFIPAGWELFRIAEFDYTGDKQKDVVLVLAHENPPGMPYGGTYPHILLTVSWVADGKYELDLATPDLVYAPQEGEKIEMSPIETLASTEDGGFRLKLINGTVDGRDWDVSFLFRDGEWFLHTMVQRQYNYDGVRLVEASNHYGAGIGKRYVASSNEDEIVGDISYEVKLDPAPTLLEYAKDVHAWARLEPSEDTSKKNYPEGGALPEGKLVQQMGRAAYSLDYFVYPYEDALGAYLIVVERGSGRQYAIDFQPATGDDLGAKQYQNIAIVGDLIYYNDITVGDRKRRSSLYTISIASGEKKVIYTASSFEEDATEEVSTSANFFFTYEVSGGQIYVVLQIPEEKKIVLHILNLDGTKAQT